MQPDYKIRTWLGLFGAQHTKAKETPWEPGVSMVFKVLPVKGQALFMEVANEAGLSTTTLLSRVRDVINSY